jgi:hypothetical protein
MATFKNQTPYGGLLEHHLRIGDTEFYVPPTAISVHRQMKNTRTQILRARNSLPKESGYFDRIVELTLFFPNMDAINMELRPLLAQVKKCPFLPIENTYLNDIHKIDAVTISGVTVQTTPGFPHTLQAQIQLYSFEPYSYIYDQDARTFDEMFDWPLFRWYYQRNLDPELAGGFATYYEPLYSELDNVFKFRVASEDDLGAMKDWKHQKKELIKEWMDTKKEDFWSVERKEGEFFENYDSMYDKAMFEYDLHYEDWDIPGLILTDFSVGFENAITSLQLQDDESPTHQYMGSQDTVLVARFQTNDEEAVASLESLIRRSTYLIREYHKEVANGFLEFDHALARLFGVKNITIEDMQVNTVQGQPGTYEVSVTMIAYNRMEKKMNEVQWLSETADWDIDKYKDQGFWSLITAPITGPGNPEDAQPGDWYKSNFIYRWGRFIGDRPMSGEMFKSLKTFFSGQQETEDSMRSEEIKQTIYDDSIKNIFTAYEVYPDLELPTYAECSQSGFIIENTNGGAFVEPDFFLTYQDGSQYYENLIDSMKQNYSITLRDGTGGEATMGGDGSITSTNDVTNKERESSQKEFDKNAGSNKVSAASINEELIDKKNLDTEDMEALLREKADAYDINQNLIVSFAKTMDSEMKQFYDKGTNSKQGKVVNDNTSAPIMMNSEFKYFTNSDGSITGDYIGVMKVPYSYGVNSNMLGKNIEYNVETGVSKMAQFYKEVESIYEPSIDGSKSPYDEDNVYKLFDLSKNKSGNEKARFAAVLMLYFGFEKEFTSLVKDNRKPPAKVVEKIQSILDGVSNEDEWSSKEIEKKTKKLPIKDFKSSGSEQSKKAEGISSLDLTKDQDINKGMLHDMIRYDRRGRLVRAFPTFFLSMVDEGRFIGTVKLSDQYFGYQAVMDIMYTNSRKEASSTLVLELSNVYGTLDDAEKQMDLTNTSYREVMKMLTMPGAVAMEAERSRNRNPNYYKSIMLRTGTRVHFRMGYGSNPMDMPTIMNGTITSIKNNGESLTVIAQDDGIELTNKIRADVNETTKGGFLSSKKEPTEIVDEILTDSQGFFKNMWAGLSNKEFENHSLGIMHFGHQQKPQGLEDAKSFFGGVGAGAITGGTVGAAAGPVGAIIGGIGGGLAGGIFGTVFEGRTERNVGEINMNVYQTTGLTNEEQDKWWSRTKDAFGIGKSDEDNINIGLFDKTPWDVLNICAAIGDDHIVAVHPFGFRNTIFSGKSYFPLHYDYIVKDGEVSGTAMKPFKQYHAYDSATSILDNSIMTSEENVRTVAVGVYMNEGEMDTTSPIYVDTNIWAEKQRVVNIDTTMNAQGVRLMQGLSLGTGLLNKPFKWYFDEGVAIKIAARGLSDYVRDMYDGYLTVMGDPSVKPYDQMWIDDTYNSINGPADVKEVTQIMNHQVGYITTMKPDAVVVNSDTRALSLGMAVGQVAATAGIVARIRKKLNTSKYAGNMPILNALWASTKSSYSKMKNKFMTGKVGSILRDKLTGKKIPNAAEITKKINERYQLGAKASDIARWSKNGMLDQLQKAVGAESKDKLTDVLKNAKKFGYSTISNPKLQKNASTLMAGGARKTRKLLKGVGGAAKVLWGAGHAATGPVGWLAYAIETLVVTVVSSTIGEFIDRWLYQRQSCLISPLMKSGMEFTAGINGHKGSVIGDSADFWQGALTGGFGGLLMGLLGVDVSGYNQDNRNGAVAQATDTVAGINLGNVASNFVEKFRPKAIEIENLDKLYSDDKKAALQQINKRLELLSRRETKAEHDEEKTSWDDWKSKIGGWFDGLWSKIKDFFGGSKDEGTCVPKGDVGTGGKAKGLSSYFKVLGPKLEKEAKAQGLDAYVEIIKAKVMQESGGNYKRYPDVMQASESLGKPIGYIKDVDASIKQGIKYFGGILKKTKGDVKMALQSYNFGSGFIDYCMKHGGKYTKDNAYNFALAQVKKHGRISSIDPGYGDSKYVDHVLRYYDGNLPSGECEGGDASGGASSCPSVTGAEGKKKYSNPSGKGLIDLKSYKGKNYGITIVGGTSTSKVRPGTAEALVSAIKIYGKSANVTSGWRPGDPAWHGTGWAVDLDTPNTMKTISGKMRFPNGSDKDNARKLSEACIKAGFRALYFGDWDIVQEMNKKYGSGTMNYDPAGHYNHLHCSYPICKK